MKFNIGDRLEQKGYPVHICEVVDTLGGFFIFEPVYYVRWIDMSLDYNTCYLRTEMEERFELHDSTRRKNTIKKLLE